MNPKLRSAMPTRFTALGFILVILGGNLWLIYMILGEPVPDAIRLGFNSGLLMAVFGGLAMAVWSVSNPVTAEEIENSEEDES